MDGEAARSAGIAGVILDQPLGQVGQGLDWRTRHPGLANPAGNLSPTMPLSTASLSGLHFDPVRLWKSRNLSRELTPAASGTEFAQ